MLAYTFTIANDDPMGTDYIGQQGGTSRVAVEYVEQGQTKRTIFDLHPDGSVTGEDPLAGDVLGALGAECQVTGGAST